MTQIQQKIKTSWNKDIHGEEYLKHMPNGKIWSDGLTKESHSSLKKISEHHKLENNPNWKGNEVGYTGLHNWIRDNKPKPNFCEHCNEYPPYDLANISGEYKRDIKDFEWLCRKCHMLSDGRINNLKRTATYNFGSKNGQSKLTEEQVKEIKQLLLKGELQENIAKKFNVGRVAITAINIGKTWKQVKINQKEAII